MTGKQQTTAAKQTRRRLFDYDASYWTDYAAPGNEVAAEPPPNLPADPEPGPEAAAVSDTPICHTCSQTFSTFLSQRAHFRSDWHKYNAQRRVRARPPLTEMQFDDLSDLGSADSLSGSESNLSDDDDDDDNDNDDVGAGDRAANALESPAGKNAAAPTVRLAEKLEFRDPRVDGSFLVVYRAALPDRESLASLATRGVWGVLMAGGGHFCAALWGREGELLKHKTFHRYTSRRKQGGSQAAADEARGAGNRIKSAGATLRRYGEQALQKEVHALLKAWRGDLERAQCIFVRASRREKRDLLLGWPGSPLKELEDKGVVRNIPIPTRRATLSEAKRVYEELSTVRISSTSLAEAQKAQAAMHKSEQRKQKEAFHAAKASKQVDAKKSDVKGTDHLKKRDEKEKKPPKAVEEVPAEDPPEVDETLAHLVQLCMAGDQERLSKSIAEMPSRANALFEQHYFAREDDRFTKLDAPIGLVGVAAICGHSKLLEWLLDNRVSPSIGASPYVAAKSKAIRTQLRAYWGKHPDRYDYASAGIPSALSTQELEEAAERERVRRRKEREKKKEKAREKAEAAKPPAQRARELRAAAAEARLLGNRCANCRKELHAPAFERLAFKYCSTECVAKHRQKLNNLPK